MKNRIAFLPALVALLAGAADQSLPVLKVGSFKEVDGRTILGSSESGTVNVGTPTGPRGVMVHADLAAASRSNLGASGFPDLVVTGISAQHKVLCVDAITVDGLYEARAIVPTTDSSRRIGAARIALPSKHGRLRKLSQIDITAVVRAGTSPGVCAGDSMVLSASWGSKASADSPSFFLGGGGLTGRPSLRRKGEASGQFCEVIASENRSLAGYRYFCKPSAAACRPSQTYVVTWVSGVERRPLFETTVLRSC